MIVNHKYKFIFIKTQKTAGTSIETALSKFCSPTDVVTPISVKDEEYRKSLGFQSPVNYSIPLKYYSTEDYLNLFLKGRKKYFYNHMSCEEIRRYLGADIFDSYYKFCFERNPYDKFLSLFFHHGGFQRWNSLEEFINKGELEIIKGFDQYTIKKVIAVDDIFKYEEMDSALALISEKLELEERLKLPPVRLKGQFRTDKSHYTELITPSVRKMIDIIWARELELMNYEF